MKLNSIKYPVILSLLILVAVCISALAAKIGEVREDDDSQASKLCMAYVYHEHDSIPDPDLFTHFFYAFADFNENNDGLTILNQGKLKKISELKKSHPDLKVILSVGGKKYEGFSEMARSKKKRRAFARSCKSILDSLNLDGVDLDWEYPGTTAGGHSASPDDAGNYVLVVKELRRLLGESKWISFFSSHSGYFIDLKGMEPYVDYIGVPGYDLSMPQNEINAKHHNNLYPSKKYGVWCIDSSIKRHIAKGIPRNKILLGIPFYGRGKEPMPKALSAFHIPQFAKNGSFEWDDEACVPYYQDKNANLLLTFDNERSIAIKCDYIRKMGLAGGFAWHYDADYPDHRLAKAMKKGLQTDSVTSQKPEL